MKAYTTVVLYPDHMTNDFGADIYVNSAEADDPHAAARAVQEMASEANGGSDEVDPDDFRVIAVFEGIQDCVLDATSYMTPQAARERRKALHSPTEPY